MVVGVLMERCWSSRYVPVGLANNCALSAYLTKRIAAITLLSCLYSNDLCKASGYSDSSQLYRASTAKNSNVKTTTRYRKPPLNVH
jgi:hypothetical protein